MSNSELTTPQQIDTRLAALYMEGQRLSSQIEANSSYIVSATNPDYYYDRRRRVTDRTFPEAMKMVTDALAAYDAEHPDGGSEWDRLPSLNSGDTTNAPTAERVRKLLTDRATLIEARDLIVAEANKVGKLYTNWTRFYLVTSSAGHVHKSMYCETCYPTTTYGWIPDLSGHTEAEAVTELGSNLCSVCFPTAPVEHQGGKFTQAQAEKIAEGGLEAARELRAKQAQTQAESCPGSGKPFEGGKASGNGRYGRCQGCRTVVGATSAFSGIARRHKAPKGAK